jgi:hypothetical protein
MLDLPPDLPDYLLTATLTVLLPTTSLILTSKNSPLRYITLATITYLSSRFIKPHPDASVIRTVLCGQLIIITAQAFHLLLIKRLDDRDIAREIPQRALFRSDRLWHAAEALVQPRGVNTPREVKNIPAHPGYYASSQTGKDGASDPIPRGQFLTRQIIIFIWQYLALDILQVAARQKALQDGGGGFDGFTRIDWFISPEKWVQRGLTNLMTWFVGTRILIDANYRFASIIFVGLGWDGPENWPPAFGRMRDVYTVRKFWG